MGSFEGLSKLIVKHTKHFLDQVNIELSSGHMVTKILHIGGGYEQNLNRLIYDEN